MSAHANPKFDGQAAIDPTTIGLDFLWLEITPRCNLNCVHCYADSDMSRALHGKLGLEDWLSLLQQAAQLGCKKVQFIGGEPTLHPGLRRMIEEAHRLGFRMIEVYTNGTHFTRELKQVFKDRDVYLAFSVYAADGDTHDLVTGHRGSFGRTITSLRWAVGAGLNVRVGVVEMDANRDQFESTKKWLRQEGVQSIKVDRVRGIGRGVKAVAVDFQMAELCGSCWRGSLCVCADGQVYPCVFSRFYPVGEANWGLASIASNGRLMSFRRDLMAMDAMSSAPPPLRYDATSAPQCNPKATCAPECNPKATCAPQCNPKATCAPECNPKATCAPQCNPKAT